jgi:hypothetical protein
MIHEILKSGWSICKVERHYKKFVMAFISAESSFWEILEINSNLMIPERKSNLLKIVAPCNSSRSLSIIGIGNLALMVYVFKAL